MDLLPRQRRLNLSWRRRETVLFQNLFFWYGQEGGLERLRQKGWTLVNLLIILRDSKIRNTNVTVLAQGDNQVITTH